MKKLILISVLLICSLTLTFGQATVGGWGRGIFVPVIVADGDPTAASIVSWGGPTRMGFTVSGTSDNIGVKMDVIVDGGSVSVGDNQFIWAKPIEILTLKVGLAWEDALRGNASFVAYNWLRYDNIIGDGAIFGRVGEAGATRGPSNVIAVLTPVDGATIFAAVGGSGGWAGNDQINLQNWFGSGPPVVDEPVVVSMLKSGQYGFGYDVPGIGLIRAQYYGALNDVGKIEAAFRLTMIEGLMADLGLRMPLDVNPDDANEGAYVMGVALYLNYVMDTMTIHFLGDFTLNEDPADPNVYLGAAIEYGLEGGLTVQGDVRYALDLSGDTIGDFGVGAFAKFSYSNGIFGIGAQVTNGNFTNSWTAMIDKTDAEAIVFAIPIRVEYWF